MTGLAWLVEDARAHVLPRAWQDALAGHRAEEWTWRILDRRGVFQGVLDGVEGGSLEMSIHADTRHSGRLSWAGLTRDMPDWDQVRIQPVYTARFPDGTGVEWPMGVFLPSTPVVRYGSAGKATVDIDLYDKTIILRQDALEEDTGYPAGTQATAIALDHATAALSPLGTPWEGRDHPAIEDSDAALRSALFWEAGASALTVCNDALQAAGFFSLWADGQGTIRSSSYVEPSARPIAWTFADGAASIRTPQWSRTLDLFDAPNKLIAISRGDGDEEALVAVEIDVDPTSPLSYLSRGRWVTQVAEGIEATSQAVLVSHARRLLREAQDRARTIELEHAPVPLAGNDRIRFVDSDSDFAVDAVVQSWRMECRPGSLWRTTVREVLS